MEYTQSQPHGPAIENELRVKVWNLETVRNSSERHDIPKHLNRHNPNEIVSIKTMKGYKVCMGDILRIYDRCDPREIYTILIARYLQVGGEKRIVEIVEMNYNEELHRLLFGTITRQEIEEYDTWIRAIPPGEPDQKVRDDYLKRKNDLQKMHHMRMNISPKVDSKRQRRVQCEIPHLDQLWEQFPQFILSRTTDQVRGIPITTTYAFGPRVRKPKVDQKPKVLKVPKVLKGPKSKKLITKD
jgi:hypothetical protein